MPIAQTVVLIANPANTAAIVLPDIGIEVGVGESITFDFPADAEWIEDLRHSEDVQGFLADDVHGVGSSSLQIGDGASTLNQSSGIAFLANAQLSIGSGPQDVQQLNDSGLHPSVVFAPGETITDATLGSDLDANGNKITGLATATDPGDATPLSQVEMLVEGIQARGVMALSEANLAITGIPAAVDGITLVDGDRVLLIAQTDPIENGPWTVRAGAWERPVWFEDGREVAGFMIHIQAGTVHANERWQVENDTGADVVGTDALVVGQFAAPAAATFRKELSFGLRARATGGTTDMRNSDRVPVSSVGYQLLRAATLTGATFRTNGPDSTQNYKLSVLADTSGVGTAYSEVALLNLPSGSSSASDDALSVSLPAGTLIRPQIVRLSGAANSDFTQSHATIEIQEG